MTITQDETVVIVGTMAEMALLVPSQIPIGYFYFATDAGPDGTLYVLSITGSVRSWKPTGSGGGPVPASYANRQDLSVNGAMVEGFQSYGAILRTQTNNSPAGSYTGGGTGNKAILGNSGFDNFPLSSLVSASWRHRNLTPTIAYVPSLTGYMNLIVELDPSGAPGVYSVFAFVHQGGGVNVGVPSTPAPDELQMDWSTPANYVQVVQDKGMYNGLGTIIAPVVGPPNFPPNVNAWPSRAYTLSSILAVYPNARIRNADPADGGMPASTIVPGVLLLLGDSGTKVIGQRLLMEWKLNGADI